jgi:hypothetical protein
MGVVQWGARGLGRDLGAYPVSDSRGLRIIGLMQALVSLSDSILVSLLLCFILRTLHYICISFVTQELM